MSAQFGKVHCFIVQYAHKIIIFNTWIKGDFKELNFSRPDNTFGRDCMAVSDFPTDLRTMMGQKQACWSQ